MLAALRRLRRRWLPSVLGVLQVALGTGTVVALLSGLLPALRAAEAPNVFTARYRGVPVGSERDPLAGYITDTVFEPGDGLFLRREAPAVERASTVASVNPAALEVNGQPYLVASVAAVEPDYVHMMELEPVAGSLFGSVEMERGAAVAVISEPVARQFFGDAPSAVGREMKLLSQEESWALQGRPVGTPGEAGLPPAATVRVIGVYRPPAGSAARIVGMEPHVLVPLGWLETVLSSAGAGGTGEPGGTARLGPFSEAAGSQLVFTARPGEEIEAQRQVEQILSPLLVQRQERQPRYEGAPPLEWTLEISPGGSAAVLGESLAASIALLGGMAFIAVVVGGVAVLTAGLVNLAYESRAIGLHKALGAGRSRIMGHVLGESVLLGGIGGLAGLLLAWPIQQWIKPLLPGPPLFPELQGLDPLAAAAGMLLSVAVGVLAGLYPGWLASRLQPAEAFREST